MRTFTLLPLLLGGSQLCSAIDTSLPPPPSSQAAPPELEIKIPDPGNCTLGTDKSFTSGDLCEFSCSFGICPTKACECLQHGKPKPFPQEDKTKLSVRAFEDQNDEMNILCLFACKHGHCPGSFCDTDPIPAAREHSDQFACITNDLDHGAPECKEKAPDIVGDARKKNADNCAIFEDPKESQDFKIADCFNFCKPQLDAGAAAGNTTNYGCVGHFPLDKPIPYQYDGGRSKGHGVAVGKCQCNNPPVTEIAEFVIQGLAMAAEIGCFLMMRTLESIVHIGTALFPEIGKPIDIALDAATTAIQTYQYLYNDSEDPKGAFDWWLSPCGDTSMVPEDLQKAFDIVDTVSGHIRPFKAPKGVKKGSGKKGDASNPLKRDRLPRDDFPGPAKARADAEKAGKLGDACVIPKDKQVRKVGSNTVRELVCDDQQKTSTVDWIVTSVVYPTATAAPTVQVTATCSKQYGQACEHYSSVIRENPKVATVTCAPDAGSINPKRDPAPAAAKWQKEHSGQGWLDAPQDAKTNPDKAKNLTEICDKSEYPPSVLIDPKSQEFLQGGTAKDAQLIRFMPKTQAKAANRMFDGVCLTGPLQSMDAGSIKAACDKSDKTTSFTRKSTIHRCKINVDKRPVFSISKFEHDKQDNDGLNANSPCWPSSKAESDPGFALLRADPFYSKNAAPKKDYTKSVSDSPAAGTANKTGTLREAPLGNTTKTAPIAPVKTKGFFEQFGEMLSGVARNPAKVGKRFRVVEAAVLP